MKFLLAHIFASARVLRDRERGGRHIDRQTADSIQLVEVSAFSNNHCNNRKAALYPSPVNTFRKYTEFFISKIQKSTKKGSFAN